MASFVFFQLIASLNPCFTAGPYGLAQKPPMGWRTWNAFDRNVDQKIMTSTMDAMTRRGRLVNGIPSSLLDVGYNRVGLDDNWQACGTGVNGSFHSADGTPLVNTERFPDLTEMCKYAHSQNLKCDWYHNTCICSENQFTDTSVIQNIYRKSVDAIVEYGFDGVKLDGCSQFHNTSFWASLLNDSGREIIIENCHNSDPMFPSDPQAIYPYNFYRTSGDIDPNFGTIYCNLHSTVEYLHHSPPLSHPGMWAFPDMLEVGNMQTYEEERSHFGAWCIMSSPLILSFDLRDEAKLNRVWDFITNTEAIAINQQWAGHPGRFVTSWGPPGYSRVWSRLCTENETGQHNWAFNGAGSLTHEGLCLDASLQLGGYEPTHPCQSLSLLQLAPCTEQPAQRFVRDSMSIRFNGSDQGVHCVDTVGPTGPAAILWDCNKSPMQTYNFTDGKAVNAEGYCLTATRGGWDLWSKPQPGGSLAVLVLSAGAPLASAYISFAVLGLSGNIHVRDIWQRRDVGTFADGFNTDEFGGKDSRFYLLVPGHVLQTIV